MPKRYTSEVILEALSYALFQAVNAQVEVTRKIETEEDFLLQIAELTEAINDCRVNLGVDDTIMESIWWFNAIGKYQATKDELKQ